jgi:hypothetical protein
MWRTLTAYKVGRPWQAALSDIWRLHGESCLTFAGLELVGT